MIKGLLYGALSAVSYGLVPLFAVPLYNRGYSPDTALFWRYLFSFFILAGMMLFRHQSFRLTGRLLRYAVLGGLLMSVSSWLLFKSYEVMDSGLSATIQFIYPTVVAGMMAVFFKERLMARTLFGTLLAMGGVMFLSVGSTGARISLPGVLYALTAAAVYASYIVLVNKSPLRTLTGEQLTCYAVLFGIPVFALTALTGSGIRMLTSLPDWGCALGLAVFPTVFSFVLLALAVRRIGATKTAILGGLEPVTTVLLGVLVLGETMTPRILLGIAVVLAAVTVVIGGRKR